MTARAPAGTRHLWLAFALAFALMAWGFAPNFWGANGPVDLIRIVHGVLAAGWMLLLIAQSWLIGHGHWRWHGRIGRASRFVTPLLVVSAFVVICDMLGPNSHFDRRLRLALAWADLWSLILFSGLYIAGIVYRRRFALHARFMAATVFVALPPALGRGFGPIFGGLEPALAPSYWAVEIALAGLIAWDASRGRFPAPFPIALAATAAFQTTMFAATGWPPYLAVATLLGLPPA